MPLLVPLVVLGTFSIVLSELYIRDYLAKNSRNLLVQTQQNLGHMLSTLDPVSELLDNDTGVGTFFDRLFSTENLDYGDVRTQNLVNGFVSSQALTRPFIHSIYVYYPNKGGYFYATGYGRMKFDDHRDREWVSTWERRRRETSDWTQVRTIPSFSGGKTTQRVISIFHPLPRSSGLVLLNLYPEGLRRVWDGLEILPGQELLVLNREGQMLVSSGESPPDEDQVRHQVFGRPAGDPNLMVETADDERFGWMVVSFTPRSALYSLPALLTTATLGLLLVSFLAGVLLTTNMVRINYHQVQTLATVLESAQEGRVPPLPQKVGTVWEKISYEVLKTFVEQDYLKLQLSEKTAQAGLLELESRQNQMNPHFLLNTMKTIYWRVYGLTGGPNEACVLIDNLSDILEYALRTPTDSVTLADEVRTTRSYLDIQAVRYAGQFRALWDIPDHLNHCSVPKLVLQPLVENAIYHGARGAGRTCGLLIRVRDDQGYLEVAVTDTGVGISAEKLRALDECLRSPSSQGRIGLENTHRRLRLVYGAPWGLSVRSLEGRGTTVRLRLPLE